MPLTPSHINLDDLKNKVLSNGDSSNPIIQKYQRVSQCYHNLRQETEPESHIVARLSGAANKYELPKDGMTSDLAYQLVHDELALDGNPLLNLASFVNVHYDDNAGKLISQSLTKNLADNDEYPMLITLQDRCVSTLGNLWNAPTKVVKDKTVQERASLFKDAATSELERVQSFLGSDSNSRSRADINADSPSGMDTDAADDTETQAEVDATEVINSLFPGATRKTQAIGTACTGSSEAIMLGGFAMKKNWQARRRKEGKDASNPNILMSSCCQVALEKFARYFDVENRLIPVSKSDYLIDYDQIRANLDENTIGIFVILGSTYTGGFENVKRVSEILDDYEKETGNWIPIHVDGASGAFVAPIIYPELEWDFRVPRVMSINTSGHKFGLTTVGLGWAIFRNREWLPDELLFQLDYLGGLEESYSINFSRPGFQVAHQYYNFQHLGRAGYYDIFDNCLTNARILSYFLNETGYFKCISNLHLPMGETVSSSGVSISPPSHHSFLSDHSHFNPALPVVSFQFTAEFIKKYPEIPQAAVSKMLRGRQWIIPNYALPRTENPKAGALPPKAQDPETGENNEILRVVVKYNLAAQLLDRLMHDIVDVVEIMIRSIETARVNVSDINAASTDAQSQEIERDMMYNMLLSISNDADARVVKVRGTNTKKAHGHEHKSYRGMC